MTIQIQLQGVVENGKKHVSMGGVQIDGVMQREITDPTEIYVTVMRLLADFMEATAPKKPQVEAATTEHLKLIQA